MNIGKLKHLFVRWHVGLGLLLGGSTILPSQDQESAKQLIRQVSAIKPDRYTQSEAHMSVPSVQELIMPLGDLANNKQIINAAFAKERELVSDFYVFYTAVPHMRLLQDVTRELYKLAIGNIGALQENAFQFIRYTYLDPTYEHYKNVSDFLIKEISTNGIIDDNDIRVRTILVSANLALLGNAGFFGESTWHYFNNPQPWVSVPTKWLEASIQSFGFSKVYVPQLLKLNALIAGNHGDIFQIFIPKKLVDQVAYISWRQGIPFDQELIKDIYDRKYIKFGYEDKIYHDEIKEQIYRIKRGWDRKDPEAIQIVKQMLDGVRQGKYYPSRILKEYVENPSKLFGINYMQARLLISSTFLLNPESGIKIYRYSKVDPAKEQIYKARLNKIIKDMELDRLRAQRIKAKKAQ